MQRPLFDATSFIAASGEWLDYKIECDALTDLDWEGLAFMISRVAKPFGSVRGVPRGGIKLAHALERHITDGDEHMTYPRLLVDDVLTTGGSIVKHRQKHDQVWVVFSRIKPPEGINALFTMHQKETEK